VTESAAPPRDPDLADQELTWSVTFEAGGYTDPAIPADSDERVALRVPEAAVAVLAPGPIPQVRDVLARGPVVFTDRRILIADGAKVTAEWPWPQDLQRVFAEASGCGVMIVPTDAALQAGQRLWGVVPPSLLGDKPPERWMTLMGWLTWNRAAAAWFAHRGRLVDWQRSTADLLRGKPDATMPK